MRPLSVSIYLGATLAAIIAAPAWSYDRNAAYTYATTWCNTNFDNRPDGKNPDGNADHVNNTSGAIHGGPGNYTWWYNTRIPVSIFGYYLFDWLTQTSDYGTGNYPSKDGYDCSNFASQVLLAGGMTLSGVDDPTHGTFTLWHHLDQTLANSANIQTVSIPNRYSNPSTLAVGDLVSIHTQHHMMVVVSTGASITLAYHSYDKCSMPLSGIPISDSVDFPLTGYHIIGNSLTASADTTPPTMVVQRSDGSIIPDGGFSGQNTLTVTVTDSGSGVQELEAFTGAPVMNGWANLQYGFATPLFVNSNLSGSSSMSTINLTYLARRRPESCGNCRSLWLSRS